MRSSHVAFPIRPHSFVTSDVEGGGWRAWRRGVDDGTCAELVVKNIYGLQLMLSKSLYIRFTV